MATTKDFDCIGFKRSAQEKIYEQIKGMTPAEEIAWFRQKVAQGPFGSWADRLMSRTSAASGTLRCNEPEEPYNDKKKNPA
jgi:hypothetical protein